MIRSLAGRAISEAVERGATLANAMKDVLDKLGRDFDADVGIVAVDDAGNAAAQHRTRDMPHAFFTATGDVVARMRA